MKQNPTIHPFSRSFCLERGSWIQKYQAERAVALSASELSEVHIRVAWVMGWIFDEYLTNPPFRGKGLLLLSFFGVKWMFTFVLYFILSNLIQ